MIKLFPARESLVSDIPAGDEKMANLFYSVEAANRSVVCSSVCELWVNCAKKTSTVVLHKFLEMMMLRYA